MGLLEGAIYTGSFSYNAGSEGDTTWLYCNGTAGQKAKVITAGTASGGIENMILSDLPPIFTTIGIWTRVVKTVHNDNIAFGGTGGEKNIFAWCGYDSAHFGTLYYAGPGAALPVIHGDSTPQHAQHDIHALSFVVDNVGANAAMNYFAFFGATLTSILAMGIGSVGVQFRLKPPTAQAAITGNNTYTVEAGFFGWT